MTIQFTGTPGRFSFAKYGVLAPLVVLLSACAALTKPATLIDPKDLAKGSYVISTPGNYRLGGNVEVRDIGAGAPVIKIAANNVTLDLDGHTVAMAISPTASANAGIEINGVSNVVVTNGTLRELSGPGIHLVCDVDPAARQCSNIEFSHLDMRNVGKRGEYLDLGNIFVRPFSGGIVAFGRSTPVPATGGNWENSITGVRVSKVTVRNEANIKHLFSGATPAGGQNGMTFASVSNLRVEDSSVAGMRSNDAAACLFLGRTKTVVVRQFDCNGATGDRNANGIDSMANVANPLAIKKNLYVLVEDTSIANILATGPRGNEALGVELNGEKFTFRNLVVTDVKNDSTTTQGNRAIGIQINSNGLSDEVGRVSNCMVKNVSQYGISPDSRAGGISIEGAPPVVISRCAVSNVINHAKSATSIKAFGYRVDPGAKKAVFEESSSEGITAPMVTASSSAIPGYVAGFVLVNARVEMNQNRSRNSHVGVFVRNLAPDSAISGNLIQCNGTALVDSGSGKNYSKNRLIDNAVASIPASLLNGTDNLISGTKGSACGN
ncbi:MAG: hypothetical protein ACKVQK_08685 [Burkholderiales bacterium]